MANENDSDGWQVVAGATKMRPPPTVRRDRGRGARRSLPKAPEGDRNRERKMTEEQDEASVQGDVEFECRIEKKLVPATPPPPHANPWKKVSVSHASGEFDLISGERRMSRLGVGLSPRIQ